MVSRFDCSIVVAQLDGIVGVALYNAKFGIVEGYAGEDFVLHAENQHGFVKGKILGGAGKRQAIFTEFLYVHNYLAVEYFFMSMSTFFRHFSFDIAFGLVPGSPCGIGCPICSKSHTQ